MAQKLGYFEEAGLDVSIDTPSDPAAPLKLVAAGSVDLAISYEPEVALAREQGLDVVAVGALVNRPLTSLIWLRESGIKGVADLKGKTVATAGIPYQDAFLKTILARVKLSPTTSKPSTSGSASCRTRRRLRPGDARRLPQRRGGRTARRAKLPSSLQSTSSASRHDELVLVARGRAWKTTPRSSASSSPPSRGTEAAVQQPGRRDRGDHRSQARSGTETDGGGGEGDLPLLGARTSGQPSATWTPRSGRPSPPGCATTN